MKIYNFHDNSWIKFFPFFLLLIFLFESIAISEEINYAKLYDSGNYKEALQAIEKRLDEIYSVKVENKRLPKHLFPIKDKESEIDKKKIIIQEFHNRKATGFFLGDEKDLSALHLAAARCNNRLKKPLDSLNHYIQSLRYKQIENSDHIIYYEIALIFKEQRLRVPYIDALENAYSLNPNESKYSFEIAITLYRTQFKKKAIYHFENYLKTAEEEIQPEIYLMIGNLNEDIGKYLETEKYYKEYLKRKPDDGMIQFALGHLAFFKTGNYDLALESLNKALSLLPEKDIYRRSKAYEYKGDMAFNMLNFPEAIDSYLQTIKYQEQIQSEIRDKNQAIDELNKNINKMKSQLLKQQDFDQYDKYEDLRDEVGLKIISLREKENDYRKLNAGRVRWYLADSYERLEKYPDAIKYYREAISYEYNANDARDKIIKLQLKIKRGY